MLILISGDKDKAVTSLPKAVLQAVSASKSSARQDLAVLTLAVVVEVVQLMLDLIAASSSTLILTEIVRTTMLQTTQDYLIYKLSEEEQAASASKVLWAAKLKTATVSSMTVAVQEQIPSLTLKLAARLLNVLVQVARLLLESLVLLIALILLLSARLSAKKSALVDVWVEEIVIMENVTAIMDLLALIALLEVRKFGKIEYRNFTCTVTQE